MADNLTTTIQQNAAGPKRASDPVPYPASLRLRRGKLVRVLKR